VDEDARILILGTGLTMVDYVLSLILAGRKGPIVALSRGGLLFALCPLTRATFREIVAVPDIRNQCLALAARLSRVGHAISLPSTSNGKPDSPMRWTTRSQLYRIWPQVLHTSLLVKLATVLSIAGLFGSCRRITYALGHNRARRRQE
jgi:hypothetical protein